jgi:hypothetical protein
VAYTWVDVDAIKGDQQTVYAGSGVAERWKKKRKTLARGKEIVKGTIVAAVRHTAAAVLLVKWLALVRGVKPLASAGAASAPASQTT